MSRKYDLIIDFVLHGIQKMLHSDREREIWQAKEHYEQSIEMIYYVFERLFLRYYRRQNKRRRAGLLILKKTIQLYQEI